jgi:hypothetical protein
MVGPSPHLFFSASSASRWMACPASAVINTSAFPDRSSAAADRGTLLHAEAERHLRSIFASVPGLPALMHERGLLDFPASFTVEDREIIQGYVDYVATVPGIHLFEFKSVFLPGVGGTADAVIIHLGDELLEIVDLKTGYHRVDPISNPQMTIYALGVLAKLDGIYDFERVRMTIFQPAVSPSPAHWEISVEHLREMGERIRSVVDDIKSGYAPFRPGGETCRWCRAKPICPALAGQAIAAAQDDFGPGGELDWEPGAQAHEQEEERAAASDEDPEAALLAMKAGQIALVRTWADAVETELRARLLGGASVPGWKVVRGRAGNRSWTAEDPKVTAEALKKVGLEPYGPPSLIGPAQAEKQAKGTIRGDAEGLRHTLAAIHVLAKKGAPGAPTVVPESDRRPAIERAALAADDFRADASGEETDE